MGNPSRASEFPNDNAEISGGGIWICSSLVGPATLEPPPYEPVPIEPFVLFFDDGDVYVEGPVELQISGGSLSVTVHSTDRALDTSCEPELTFDLGVEAPGAAIAAPASEVPAFVAPEAPAFAHFEEALASSLMAHGASRSAALVSRLLRLEPLPADSLSKEVQLTLQSRGYLDAHARYTQKYRELCSAWSAVLRGSSEDFAACGTTTLDRFGADLLAALLAVPATRADELRRELRRSGIAAFGVLQAA